MARFTLEEKIEELEREIAFRRTVYRRLVRDNKMSALEAADRIAIMETILEDYKRQNEPELGLGE